MEFTAKQIADFLKGIVEGDSTAKVNNVSKIEEGTPGTLSFLANPKYTHFIYSTKASIVLVNNDFKADKEISTTLIRVENAYQSFASLLDLYNQSKPEKTGIENYSFIDSSATIGENCYIGAFAYIAENVIIGNNVKIYPHAYIGRDSKVDDNSILFSGVKVYHECKIGKNCIIHSGTVIGSDGFGFAPQTESDYKKVPQLGNVILEDEVEIGANSAIDRATMGSTIIRRGVKLDNLIQIAHNVEIGERTVIAAQSGFAGSAKVGMDCMFGGQVGIAGHLSIADQVKVGAQSGVASSIKNKGTVVLGSPSLNILDFHKSHILFKQLPDLNKKLQALTQEIERLTKKVDELS